MCQSIFKNYILFYILVLIYAVTDRVYRKFNESLQSSKHKKMKVWLMLTRPLKLAHSLARSHYRPTRGLLAARFPAWPDLPLLSQPGSAGLLQPTHVDDRPSADTWSTCTTLQQLSQSHAIHFITPPSRGNTGTRHVPSDDVVDSTRLNFDVKITVIDVIHPISARCKLFI